MCYIFLAMPLIYGLISLALAAFLTAIWWTPAFVAALQVLFVIGLFFGGLIFALVGYSEMKAAREFKDAVSGDTVTGDSDTPTSSSE